MTRLHRDLERAITEAAWQKTVVDCATVHGWKHLHVRRSRARKTADGTDQWATTTNIAGWPDLFLWHPRHGFVAAELKKQTGRPTAEQLAVLAELEAAGAQVFVWRPSDFDQVVAVFSGARP